MTDWERHNNMNHLRGMSPMSGDGRVAHWAADRIEALESELDDVRTTLGNAQRIMAEMYRRLA